MFVSWTYETYDDLQILRRENSAEVQRHSSHSQHEKTENTI